MADNEKKRATREAQYDAESICNEKGGSRRDPPMEKSQAENPSDDEEDDSSV